jgi:hypothetical protein
MWLCRGVKEIRVRGNVTGITKAEKKKCGEKGEGGGMYTGGLICISIDWKSKFEIPTRNIWMNSSTV